MLAANYLTTPATHVLHLLATSVFMDQEQQATRPPGRHIIAPRHPSADVSLPPQYDIFYLCPPPRSETVIRDVTILADFLNKFNQGVKDDHTLSPLRHLRGRYKASEARERRPHRDIGIEDMPDLDPPATGFLVAGVSATVHQSQSTRFLEVSHPNHLSGWVCNAAGLAEPAESAWGIYLHVIPKFDSDDQATDQFATYWVYDRFKSTLIYDNRIQGLKDARTSEARTLGEGDLARPDGAVLTR